MDTSEPARVFGALKTPETVSETVTSDDARQAVTGPNSGVLQAQLDAAQQVIKAQEARIADLQTDKDRLWSQVESQQLLIEHKPQEQHGSRFIEIIVAAAIALLAITAIVILLR